MSYLLDSLRLHAHVEEIIPLPEDGWTELKIKLVHNEDIQGECHLSLWAHEAAKFHLGQELCGLFTLNARPLDNGIRVSAQIQTISNPFDSSRRVELKIKQYPRDNIKGECRLRIRIGAVDPALDFYHPSQDIFINFSPVGDQ